MFHHTRGRHRVANQQPQRRRRNRRQHDSADADDAEETCEQLKGNIEIIDQQIADIDEKLRTSAAAKDGSSGAATRTWAPIVVKVRFPPKPQSDHWLSSRCASTQHDSHSSISDFHHDH